MNNLLNKIKNGLSRFFAGRYGIDQLGMAMLVLSLILSFFTPLIKNEIVYYIFYVIRFAVLLLCVLRILSKNRGKRYAENSKYLVFYGKVQSSITGFISRIKDKEHRYYRCECGTYLRVPKGKGKIKITCSKCGKQMVKKS